MKLLNHVYNFLVVGPSGTGKTTFLTAYAEHHHHEFNNNVFWLTFPSIRPYLDKLLPDWVHTTTDPMDPRFAGSSENPPRTAVIADEIARLISKYDHAKKGSRAFVDLIGIHRHKNFDFLASDQVFDFLKGVRTRAHWLVFTGLNDTIYYSLRDNLSPHLIRWLDMHQGSLLMIGEANRESIPNGQGKVVITNGFQSYVLPFERPEWYSQELSTIWKNVSPEDLRKDQMAQQDEDPPMYDFDSKFHRSLMLAYHLFKKIFPNQKLTKERLAAVYLAASAAVYDTPRKLPDNGRGAPELLLVAHSHCPYCANEAEYVAALKKLKQMGNGKTKQFSDSVLKLEDHVVRRLIEV